tara:strand:- start:304 stop:642 length:339 start_codon:yes stop_codon:yes gene_type:complete
MLGHIQFWQWLGRLAPMVALLGLCLTLWLGPDTWSDVVIIAIAVSFGIIAFAWWWWVIFAVKNLTDMLKQSQEDFLKVIKDIGELKHEISKGRRASRRSDVPPEKDLNNHID